MEALRKFDTHFGTTGTVELERKRFMNRFENGFFNKITNELSFEEYNNVFGEVCYRLGENSDEIIRQYQWPGQYTIPSLKVIAKNDFVQTLRLLVALYTVISNEHPLKQSLEYHILDAINLSHGNLGIRWADGIFYPVGEKLLDDELINHALQSLIDYPNEQKDIKLALQYYSAGTKGVVENCYNAMEGLIRHVLGNNKTLLNNKIQLLQFISASKHWSGILSNYIDYANESSRHAGDNRHDLNPEEVESYLYLTCLMIRIVVSTVKSK